MKQVRHRVLFFAALLLSLCSFAQNIVLNGTLRNSLTGEPVPSVSVSVKGGTTGTFTNENGAFRIQVPSLPVTLVFSSVGFQSQELDVTSATQTIDISFQPGTSLGQEVVVSASRVPERILESPVSVERVNTATIRNAPAANYYDLVTNLKGVDVVASSLTFRTPSTRGFVGSGNTRFNQLVDGMDNQAPGLNFSVGSVIGLTELDVDNMELLPGASSALYGSGGMNGTLLINSKNPFRYQGLSFQVKTGVMHLDDRTREASPYYNWSLRYAKKVSERFAYKFGTELIQAKDWVSDDYRNYKRLGTNGSIVAGTRETDPNYDGINVYGDETSIPFRTVLNGIGAAVPFLTDYVASLPGTNINVSRTGYTENEVANPNTINFKLSGALHYKLTDKIEAVLAGNWGTGNTVYTGSQRYSLKDLRVGQYKLELNSDKWFVRAYTTQENAGESHNLTITTQLFNEAWKPSTAWYQQYGFAYINAVQAGRSIDAAHAIARATADQGRPSAGSAEFKRIFDQVRKRPIPQGGLFLDRSDLYVTEGQYNLTSAVKFAEVIVGGNWRRYVLNSEGTLFADKVGEPIKINEYGAYIQVGKEIIKDVLKLTASGRYDKNQYFKGRFTPRVTAVLKPAPDHNIRLSYQTAYRFPSTQQQWINLNVGTGTLIGSNISLWEMYNLLDNPGYAPEALPNAQKVTYKEVKPESVAAMEAGYRTVINKKLFLDVYGYYGTYQNFLSRRDVIQWASGQPGPINEGVGFSIVVNSPEKVKTIGWGAGFEYLLPANFVLGVNLSSDQIRDVPEGFRAFFNAPKLRSVVSIANSGFGPSDRLGFTAAWRWQEGFFFENDFVEGDLPAYHTVDASFNIKLPKVKSMVKLGATNLLNQYYRTALGNPSIGGLYYVSYAFNVL
ncbi:TonB-dependent receptor [Paracnuella aquatica]|uniref:TonB-dependent receptor n=1 Tax=Paracnuella aquatica TaxID=2268757 RepID=UPI000DEF9768|nr:TonB-dependent receptor [Paracnuella aquatica]RPD51122.1 TonB-dependent receptor [Paracnuella aquatica]